MKPRANHEQCEHLAFLLNDGQWHFCRELEKRMNGRMVRAACEQEPGRFMSSQRGYRLVKFGTIDEIDGAIADLLSRSTCLKRRAEGLASAKFIRSAGTHAITQQAELL